AQVMKTSRFIASGMELSSERNTMHVAQKWEPVLGQRHAQRPTNNARLAGNCFAFYEDLMIKSERPTIFRSERSPLKVTLLVFSGSSIMCVASAVDPLRAANRICGETLFDFKLVSVTGEAPLTTCGLPVAVSDR